MTAYFRDPKLGGTFYGQPLEASPTTAVEEFDIVGITDDFITAARAPTRTRVGTIHVFSRHTGCSVDGWAHVAWFQRPVNRRRRIRIAAVVFLLTLAGVCVFLAA